MALQTFIGIPFIVIFAGLMTWAVHNQISN